MIAQASVSLSACTSNPKPAGLGIEPRLLKDGPKREVGEENARALESRPWTPKLGFHCAESLAGYRALCPLFPSILDGSGPWERAGLTCVGVPRACCWNLLHLPPPASPWPLTPPFHSIVPCIQSDRWMSDSSTHDEGLPSRCVAQQIPMVWILRTKSWGYQCPGP